MNASGILLAGMSGLFVLALGYVVIFVLYQRRMIAKDLEKQKLELGHQKKLLQAVIENQEAERRRIAHDLHDEIGALLTTSRLYFSQLSPGRAEEQLEIVGNKINLLFDEMMTNIRRVSHDLRPVVLENLGLLEAVESLSNKLDESGLEFKFVHQVPFTMSREAELMLYRIIQEFVSNTLKHAHASQIDLKLEVKNDHLYLNYSDDGVGFSSDGNKSGLGLRSIESRLSLMEASMQQVEAVRGTAFVISLPVTSLIIRKI